MRYPNPNPNPNRHPFPPTGRDLMEGIALYEEKCTGYRPVCAPIREDGGTDPWAGEWAQEWAQEEADRDFLIRLLEEAVTRRDLLWNRDGDYDELVIAPLRRKLEELVWGTRCPLGATLALARTHFNMCVEVWTDFVHIESPDDDGLCFSSPNDGGQEKWGVTTALFTLLGWEDDGSSVIIRVCQRHFRFDACREIGMIKVSPNGLARPLSHAEREEFRAWCEGVADRAFAAVRSCWGQGGDFFE